MVGFKDTVPFPSNDEKGYPLTGKMKETINKNPQVTQEIINALGEPELVTYNPTLRDIKEYNEYPAEKPRQDRIEQPTLTKYDLERLGGEIKHFPDTVHPTLQVSKNPFGNLIQGTFNYYPDIANTIPHPDTTHQPATPPLQQ